MLKNSPGDKEIKAKVGRKSTSAKIWRKKKRGVSWAKKVRHCSWSVMSKGKSTVRVDEGTRGKTQTGLSLRTILKSFDFILGSARAIGQFY